MTLSLSTWSSYPRASLLPGTCIQKEANPGFLTQHSRQQESKSCKAPYSLDPELSQHPFHEVLFVQASHEVSPDLVREGSSQGLNSGKHDSLGVYCKCGQSLSHVQLFWDPMGCNPPGSSVHGIFPSKNIGVGCHFHMPQVPKSKSYTYLGRAHCLMTWWLESHWKGRYV